MSFAGSGTLWVKPQTGKLTRDTDYFGKMDPYVIVRMGGNSQRTKEDHNGGCCFLT
jgi:hypothetical protein